MADISIILNNAGITKDELENLIGDVIDDTIELFLHGILSSYKKDK